MMSSSRSNLRAVFFWVCVGSVVSVSQSGCTSRFARANQLAKEGRFVDAAELFDQLAKESPQDSELPKLVERARYKAVEYALSRARRLRLTQQAPASQRAFAEGLTLRERWNVKLNGALEGTVSDEREDAEKRLRSEVNPLAEKGEALAAESVLEAHAFLLRHQELRDLREELSGRAFQSGKRTCGALAPSAASRTEPYWNSLVVAYCRHFDARAPAEAVLPDTLSRIEPDTRIGGLGEGNAQLLTGALLGVVQSGPWFSERGPGTGRVSARGDALIETVQEPVIMSAPWRENVPYVEHVKKTLTRRTPVRECETYNEYDPNSTDGQKTKTRTVERDKVTTEEVIVPETRFRIVPRSFSYQALRMEQRLRLDVGIELSGGGAKLSASGFRDHRTEVGHVHDVQFEAAAVFPQRANFTSTEGWLAARVDAVAERFESSLLESWRSRFCSSASPSLEEAARCSRVSIGVPESSTAVLRTKLGKDAVFAPRLLRVPRKTQVAAAL